MRKKCGMIHQNSPTLKNGVATDTAPPFFKEGMLMIKMSFSELAAILNAAPLTEDGQFVGVSTDTRTLAPGHLFVALRGEQYDAHDFVAEAAKKRASAALVNHPVDVAIPQIVVSDTLAALGKLSANWRQRFSIPFIGITGSNGKTTLKNMTAAILRAACGNDNAVLATEGNLNNNIGLPLTLLRLSETHRYAVIEMGMNHFGEIAYLTELTEPSIAIITNAAECHLEGVKSVAGVAQAKGEIFQGLTADGIAILNRDDDFFDYWRQQIGQRPYLTFGLKHPADISAVASENSLTLKTPAGHIDLVLPLPGSHNIMNALAATAGAIALNIDLTAIKKGLEAVTPTPGRMKQYFLDNGLQIIDDTYNANPFSLQAAVNTLTTFHGKKIVVLGDMGELGPDAEQIHFKAGLKIREANIDYLFTLGHLSAATSKAFGENAHHFNHYEKLIIALQPFLTKEVTVLVKGSRSMKMENIIAAIVPQDQLENTH